jgi:hypothetical protein
MTENPDNNKILIERMDILINETKALKKNWLKSWLIGDIKQKNLSELKNLVTKQNQKINMFHEQYNIGYKVKAEFSESKKLRYRNDYIFERY